MLKSRVDDVDERVGALHDKLVPLNIDEFKIYAEKAALGFKVIDVELAEFSQ